jgi:hypothetical protein
MTFKPNLGSGGRKAVEKQKPTSQKSKSNNGKELSISYPPERTHLQMPTPTILPIPLREDLTIFIQGLPFDLSGAEANKIANVVKAMANQE